MKHIEQTYVIDAPADQVWQALTDPNRISEWGGGPAKMTDSEGAEFSLWGGDIYGKNTKVVPNQILEQDWFGGRDWQQPSRVTFTLESDNRGTKVHLVQHNVPDTEAKDIEQGWKDYYMGPLKELLEHRDKA